MLSFRFRKMWYNVALRMMNHSEDAKDISQEVFLKAYRNIGNFDERSQFSTWIYRITANTCIDEMRKRKGRQSFSLEEELESEEGSMQRQVADAGETPEESMLREEQKSEILQALESLSPEHKVAVILRDIKGLCLRGNCGDSGAYAGNGEESYFPWAKSIKAGNFKITGTRCTFYSS